jgi:hypothetical protein
VKHTTLTTIIAGLIIGAVVLWALQGLLIMSGQPALVPPITWGVALGIMGISVLALARQVKRHVSGDGGRGLLDPLYATRVVLLAKSSSVAGSALSGAAVGWGIFFLTRPVITPATLWLGFVALVGAIVLMVSGLVAERWCTVPPDSNEPQSPRSPEGELG